MNITEDYCSFEVAKLLKEKGFKELCNRYYNSQFNEMRTVGDICMMNWNSINDEFYISIPTHQMAIAWLREAHGIFILIKPCDSYFDEEYEFSIYKKQNTVIFEWELLEIENSLYEGYEETVEAALKYVLENLI